MYKLLVGALVALLLIFSDGVAQEQPGPERVQLVCQVMVLNMTPYKIGVGIRVGSQARLLTVIEPSKKDIISGPCDPGTISLVLGTTEEEQRLINGDNFMQMVVRLDPKDVQVVIAFPEGTYIPGMVNRRDEPQKTN